MQVLASQLHFLANKNAELAIPPLFWPVNCIKIGGHVALLSDPTVYSLYCAYVASEDQASLFGTRIVQKSDLWSTVTSLVAEWSRIPKGWYPDVEQTTKVVGDA